MGKNLSSNRAFVGDHGEGGAGSRAIALPLSENYKELLRKMVLAPPL